MPFSAIRYEVEDGVCAVTLNRPDRLNVVDATMLDELRQAWDLADSDDAVRAVIVTGAGRAFCAGADLGPGSATFDFSSRASAGGAQPRDGLQRATPTIAPRPGRTGTGAAP